MESTKIDLYDTAQQVITNNACSTASVTGTKIGEARVRSIEFVSGTKGFAYFLKWILIAPIPSSMIHSMAVLSTVIPSLKAHPPPNLPIPFTEKGFHP